MNISTEKTAGWANYPRITAAVARPENRIELADYLHHTGQCIARGNGKSYGDASLAPNMVSMLGFRKILEFDREKGEIDCEAGVLLADILPLIVPAGWFFYVTPGIKAITIGGAIASDVHGKNHPVAGCFSNWLLSFELMRADGEVLTCSRSENAGLFWQTCGGMGWTGIVLSARFRLRRISSVHLRQKTVEAGDFETLWRAFEENERWPYAAGWVDGLSPRHRGVALFAEHLESDAPDMPLRYEVPKPKNIPFYAPSGLLNPLSTRIHNYFYHRKNKSGERMADLESYFYPLDRTLNWNRLYGRRGFVQYQFCLPEKAAFDGLIRVLDAIRAHRQAPFLTVLKKHGERPPEAVHSFPVKGWSLALDFPRTGGLPALVRRLDDIVRACEGKIYLTKDACSAPDLGRIDPAAFGEEKFWSLLKGRMLSGG